MFDQNEVALLIQELIRRPSRNPPGEEKECSLFIYEYLRHYGVEVSLIDSPFPERPQVVAWVRGTVGSPTLILNGHIDVVPEGNPDDWSFPPFGGVIKNGRVYGRGAEDMKGAIALMMLAARHFKDSEPLRGNLMMQFVVGEETGEPGTKHLLIDQNLRGDWGIVLEATELEVSPAQNGLIWYQIDVRGRQSHASRPQDGVNAVLMAARLAIQIGDYGEALTLRKHPLGNTATASPTMITGGLKENIIPDHVTLKVDRRILPGETVETVDAEMQKLLAFAAQSNPGAGYSLKKVRVFESAEVDQSNPIVQVLHRHSRELAGVPDRFWGEFGSTDARNFINDAGIPCVVWGPGSHEGSHTIDENIKVEEVIKALTILERTARELLA